MHIYICIIKINHIFTYIYCNINVWRSIRHGNFVIGQKTCGVTHSLTTDSQQGRQLIELQSNQHTLINIRKSRQLCQTIIDYML